MICEFSKQYQINNALYIGSNDIDPAKILGKLEKLFF